MPRYSTRFPTFRHDIPPSEGLTQRHQIAEITRLLNTGLSLARDNVLPLCHASDMEFNEDHTRVTIPTPRIFDDVARIVRETAAWYRTMPAFEDIPSPARSNLATWLANLASPIGIYTSATANSINLIVEAYENIRILCERLHPAGSVSDSGPDPVSTQQQLQQLSEVIAEEGVTHEEQRTYLLDALQHLTNGSRPEPNEEDPMPEYVYQLFADIFASTLENIPSDTPAPDTPVQYIVSPTPTTMTIG